MLRMFFETQCTVLFLASSTITVSTAEQARHSGRAQECRPSPVCEVGLVLGAHPSWHPTESVPTAIDGCPSSAWTETDQCVQLPAPALLHLWLTPSQHQFISISMLNFQQTIYILHCSLTPVSLNPLSRVKKLSHPNKISQ